MSRDLWIRAAGVAASAVAVLSAGCESKCTDTFDCQGQGPDFVCVDGACVREDRESDAGSEDAGTTDGGEYGGTDAGETDAGPDCTGSNLNCAGAFRCAPNPDGGTGACEALWVAVTQSIDATMTQATLVRFNDETTRVTLGTGGDSTREPRFSGDGSRVAFVAEPADGGAGAGTDGGVLEPQIRQAALPFDGSFEVLATATDAGVGNFTQLAYEPANSIAWTRVMGEMNSREGIQYVPALGGAVRLVSATGTQSDWFPDRLAFTNSGVQVFALKGGSIVTLTNDPNDEQPSFSPSGDWLLFQRLGPNVADPNQPFTRDLYVMASAGGTPVPVETHTLPVGTVADGGTVGRFVQYPSWGETDGKLVYVRFNWFLDAAGNATACAPTHPICNGMPDQQILVVPFDGVAGTPGTPVSFGPGTQPSLSPDGTYLAYVTGNGLGQLVLRIAPVNPDGSPVEGGTVFEHAIPGVVTTGPESRPRWQPKQ